MILCCSGKSMLLFFNRLQENKGIKVRCSFFKDMNEGSILVLYDLCLLALYLLQQQKTGISTSAQVR